MESCGLKRASESNADSTPSAKYTKVCHGSKSWDIMRKMGYKPNTGLGSCSQGRVEPIQPSRQNGKRNPLPRRRRVSIGRWPVS